MTYKKLTCGFLIALAAFVALNFVIWKCCTERLLTDSDGSGGDLARTSYLVGAKLPRLATVDLPSRHLECKDYQGQKIDVLTIGDSFSNGGGGGRNAYYQDYIASLYNLSVLNMGVLDPQQGALATLSLLLNSGYLDNLAPKFVLIQSVERMAVERFGRQHDYSQYLDIQNITQRYGIHVKESAASQPSKEASNDSAKEKYINVPTALPTVKFINTGNLKYLYYSILYKFMDSPTQKVLVKRLSKSFFSSKLDDRLLFWHDDIRNLSRQTPDTIALMNDNFNRMADLLAIKGIKLYFMPTVDKYDLYREFLVNNPYPPNPFFEKLRILPKRYYFIDTKAILAEGLRQGEKDLYYPDDTHWSWKASERIFKQVRFE